MGKRGFETDIFPKLGVTLLLEREFHPDFSSRFKRYPGNSCLNREKAKRYNKNTAVYRNSTEGTGLLYAARME